MKYIFSLVFFYLVFIEPILEAYYFKWFEKNQNKARARIDLYRSAFLRNWMICLFILIVAYIYAIPFSKFGFRASSFSQYMTWDLNTYLMLACCVAYFAYFYMYVFLPLFSHRLKNWVAKKLIPVVCIAPASASEKRWWVLSSLTASAEEVFYRGFIFFYVEMMLPGTSIWWAILTSVIVDALRYWHRPIAIFYVAYSALAFSSLYVLSGSILVPMIAHIIHDFRALIMPLKRARELLLQQDLGGMPSR